MNILKRILSKIYYYLPISFLLKKIIIFESNPDFCDNPRGIYDRLLELGLNKEYKLVWFVTNKDKFNDIVIPNVIFVDWNDKKTVKHYQRTAKYILDCNRFIYKKNKYQLRIHLTHGTPLKYAGDYCKECGRLDYVTQISDYFTNITMDLFNIPREKVLTTGFPRNDILLRNNSQIFYPEIKREKTICWFPTYRNHINHSSGKNTLPYGIPSINSEQDLQELNELLKKNKVLLVIKLHPAEDTTILKKLNLDYIKLIEDSVFDIDHSSLYHYLSNVDALITDYSSVYYDFLLTKKPIGLAIGDISEYKKTTKLIFDDFENNVMGEYIYTFKDLLTFVNNVANNNDVSYEKRMEAIKRFHKYDDNNSSDRLIEIIKKG